MADIVILGMEMPHGCDDCKLRHRHQGAYCVDYCVPLHTTVDPWTFGRERNGDKPDWCPLLPLPAGHGRLVDAEEIRTRLSRKLTACKPGTIEKLTFAVSIDIVDHADTIVPAEGGGEE